MKSSSVFLLFVLVGILVLLFVASSETFFDGEVVSVSVSSSRTVIVVDGFPFPLVVFDQLFSLGVGDRISFSGREDSYRGEVQFLVDRLFLIS